jgi:aspartyl protease family protein
MAAGVRFALLLVVAVGIALGFAVPVARKPVADASRQTPVVTAHATTPATASDPAPPPSPDPAGETVIERSASGHFLAVADVNGEPTHMVIDTGASTVALTTDDARRAHVDFDPALFTVIGSGASGDVRGERVMIESIALDGKRVAGVPGVVLDGLPISLLGQSYLAKLDNVEISHDTMHLR